MYRKKITTEIIFLMLVIFLSHCLVFAEMDNKKAIKQTNFNEIIRRQQHEMKAQSYFKSAVIALKNGRYDVADSKFKLAIGEYKLSSQSEPRVLNKIQEIKKQEKKLLSLWSKSLIAKARNEKDVALYDSAIKKLERAIVVDSTKKRSITKLIKEINEERAKAILAKEISSDSIDPYAKKRKKELFILFAKAKVFYQNRRFGDALDYINQILIKDLSHKNAITLQRIIHDKMKKIAIERGDSLQQEAMAEVEWKWQQPVTPLSALENFVPDEGNMIPIGPVGGIYDLLKIKIPIARFDDATIDSIVTYLKRVTKELSPDGQGLNIILKLRAAPSNNVEKESDDEDGDFDDEDEPDEKKEEEAGGTNLINMELEDIEVGKLIKFVCNAAGFNYKIEGNVVIIADKSIQLNQMETKFYSVSSSFVEIVPTRGNTGLDGGDGDGEDVSSFDLQKYFEDLGVTFGAGAKIKHVANVSKLVVTNTPVNLRKVEQILTELAVNPKQVTIETKFVELQESENSELSFRWLLLQPATTAGGNVVVLPNTGQVSNATGANRGSVLSQGVRNFGTVTAAQNAPPPNFDIDFLFGTVDLNSTINMLSQRTNVNVMSAPRVTTVNGESAMIKVINERYFPTEWQVPTISTTGGATATSTLLPSSPVYGETRDVGIILNITPQIDPDGSTIELELQPEVVQFIRYDTSFNTDLTVNGVSQLIRFDMPILSVRKVETKVQIFDGETIVLGGLINENSVLFKDKVPFISKIPIIGSLFKSQGKQNVKSNLLIFVTARLISPAGLPLRTLKIKGLPEFTR